MNRYRFLYDRQLLKNLLLQLSLWTGFFTVLFILSVFLEKADTFLEQRTSADLIAKYLLRQLPFWIWKSGPLAFLGASLATLDQANRTGELTALESLGISRWRIYLPVFAVSITLTLAGSLGLESQAPLSYREARIFFKTEIEHKKFKHLEPLSNFFVKGGQNRYYAFGHYLPEENRFEDFWLEEWEENKKIRQVFAKRGYYNSRNHLWHLEEAAERGYYPQETLKLLETMKLPADHPSTLLPTVWRIEEMTLPEIKNAARINLERGMARKNLLAEYYHRISWPLSFIVLALAAVAVLGLFPKTMFQGKLLLFGITLVTGLAYWFLVNLSKTLASHGILPVLWAAWSPHAAILGTILLARFTAAKALGRI